MRPALLGAQVRVVQVSAKPQGLQAQRRRRGRGQAARGCDAQAAAHRQAAGELEGARRGRAGGGGPKRAERAAALAAGADQKGNGAVAGLAAVVGQPGGGATVPDHRSEGDVRKAQLVAGGRERGHGRRDRPAPSWQPRQRGAGQRNARPPARRSRRGARERAARAALRPRGWTGEHGMLPPPLCLARIRPALPSACTCAAAPRAVQRTAQGARRPGRPADAALGGARARPDLLRVQRDRDPVWVHLHVRRLLPARRAPRARQQRARV